MEFLNFGKRGFFLVSSVFVLVLLGNILFVEPSKAACTPVTITQLCPDGTGSSSSCFIADYPGTGLCPCTPAPLPACPAASLCGNGVCEGAERCSSCSRDCGTCSSCSPLLGHICNSAPNRCGQTSIGIIQCNGACSAAPLSDALCGAATYTIDATADWGCSISPSGSLTNIPFGATQGYAITAESGFEVSSVVVDNLSVGSVSDYTFNFITSDHAIHAVCAPLSSGCGNGVVEAGEACDAGAANWVCPAACSLSCQNNTCASGVAAAYHICPNTATVAVGGTRNFTAYYTPAGTDFISCDNTTGAVDQSARVYWATDNPLSANIIGAGLVAGVTAGTSTNVTIHDLDVDLRATASVTVSGPAAAALNICPAGTPTVEEGATQNLTAWYTPAGVSFLSCADTTGAQDQTNTVTWSSNTSKATVESSGVVHGVTATGGTPATITANDSVHGVSDTIDINVIAACVPDTCANHAARAAGLCTSDTFTINPGCGSTSQTCLGTRVCDYNWREVAP